MSKKMVSMLCSSVLLMSLTSPAFAAETSDVMKAITKPVIDGKDDAAWEQAVTYNMSNYIVAIHDHEKLDPVKEPDDFSGHWKALWDETNFYLLIDIKDQKRISWMKQNDRKEVHFDDNVLFYLAPSMDKKYITALWHAGSKEISGWYGPPSWNSYDLSKIDYALHDYGSGYTLEAAIPWSLVGMQPSVGATALFDAHATDNDIGGDYNAADGANGRYPQSKITWNDKLNKAWSDNSNLGTIVLKGGSSSQQSSLSLFINGHDRTSEAAPTLIGDTTFVPLRMIFEALGADVYWDQATKSVTAVKGETTVSLTIGSATAAINEEIITLDAPPQLVDGSTMVPLRFVSEALGAEVSWDEATKTIGISSN
ncbi:stalk domain-containing protein [Paenibacillus sp. y28]|uniref:stalk domain-containing protein n=1 Tax=Paenibacillus sp. y28 TaxID=3129110 RepID=UPI0030193D97